MYPGETRPGSPKNILALHGRPLNTPAITDLGCDLLLGLELLVYLVCPDHAHRGGDVRHRPRLPHLSPDKLSFICYLAFKPHLSVLSCLRNIRLLRKMYQVFFLFYSKLTAFENFDFCQVILGNA